MNICITSQGPDLTSRFEPHFARASYFVFYDSRIGQVHAIRNGFTVNDTRIGQNVVKLLSSYHVDTVITGKTGSNAHNLLQAANITITIWPNDGTVRQALISVFPDIQNLNEDQTGSKNTAEGR